MIDGRFIWVDKQNNTKVISFKQAIRKYWLITLGLGATSLLSFILFLVCEYISLYADNHSLYELASLLLFVSCTLFGLMLFSSLIMSVFRLGAPTEFLLVLEILLCIGVALLLIPIIQDAFFSSGWFAGLLAVVLIIFVVPPIIITIIILGLVRRHILKVQRKRLERHKATQAETHQ